MKLRTLTVLTLVLVAPQQANAGNIVDRDADGSRSMAEMLTTLSYDSFAYSI